MGTFTLKGHVSYALKRKYKWVTEFGENTCAKCTALDGKEYEEDEVPQRPHPNFLGIQAFAPPERSRSQGALLSVSPA